MSESARNRADDLQALEIIDRNRALAGSLLPFGRAEGSAISFIIDILLCGVPRGSRVVMNLHRPEDLAAELLARVFGESLWLEFPNTADATDLAETPA